MKKFAPGIVAACLLASSAQAMDLDAVKAHREPGADSAQEAQVCAAVFAAYAFMSDDPEAEDTKRNVILVRLWAGIAAEKSGTTYDSYINNDLFVDVKGLASAEEGTLEFYMDYCLTASRRILEESASKNAQ